MWSKRYNYSIIDKKDYNFQNTSWIDDWYEFSIIKAEERGLDYTVAESFATNITNLMANVWVLPPNPNSYLNEQEIQREIDNIKNFYDGNYMMEWEQKKKVFHEVLDFYCGDLSEYEKRVVSVFAHLPAYIYDYIKQRPEGVVGYVTEQTEKYLKDRTIKKQPYRGEHRVEKPKESTFHFQLTPTEYQRFKKVDGETNSNKMMNLYVHDLERTRQKKRRIEILNTYFPK